MSSKKTGSQAASVDRSMLRADNINVFGRVRSTEVFVMEWKRRMDRLNLPTRLSQRIALIGLSLFFIAAGLNHFANPNFYVQMMPPYLPAHRELVMASGVLEILGGVGALLPKLRSAAGIGLVLLLVAVFPANLHMALHPELFPSISPVALYLRLPLQLALIAWARWATTSGTATSPVS